MNVTYTVPSSTTGSPAFPISHPNPSSSTSWEQFTLTQKNINQYYNIDRKLYTRLVFELGRDPVGSMHVMATWIWLERMGCHRGNLVNLLLSYPDALVRVLADEATLCLLCIEHNDYHPDNDFRQIPVTQSLTGVPLSLRFFYDNRAEIATGILKIVNDICIKAFQDLMHEAMQIQSSIPPNNPNHFPENYNHDLDTNFHASNPNSHSHPHDLNNFQNLNLGPDYHFRNPNPPHELNLFPNPNASRDFHMPNHSPGANFHVPNVNHRHNLNVPNPTQPHNGFYGNPRDAPLLATPGPSHNNPQANYTSPYFSFFKPQASGGEGSSSSINIPRGGVVAPFVKEGGYLDLLTRPSHDFELEDHKEFLNNEITDVLNRLHIEVFEESGSEQDEAEDIPSDERTIFLTFSKGYPISEKEVREFFTRKYGDIFEAIHMQEVNTTEQPLYARLVVRSATSMDVVLDRQGKAKFSINGKHVWARKYVRKLSTSPRHPSVSPPHGSTGSPSHFMRASSSSRSSFGPIQFGSV